MPRTRKRKRGGVKVKKNKKTKKNKKPVTSPFKKKAGEIHPLDARDQDKLKVAIQKEFLKEAEEAKARREKEMASLPRTKSDDDDDEFLDFLSEADLKKGDIAAHALEQGGGRNRTRKGSGLRDNYFSWRKKKFEKDEKKKKKKAIEKAKKQAKKEGDWAHKYTPEVFNQRPEVEIKNPLLDYRDVPPVVSSTKSIRSHATTGVAAGISDAIGTRKLLQSPQPIATLPPQPLNAIPQEGGKRKRTKRRKRRRRKTRRKRRKRRR